MAAFFRRPLGCTSSKGQEIPRICWNFLAFSRTGNPLRRSRLLVQEKFIHTLFTYAPPEV